MNNNQFLDMFEKELCEYTGAKYCVLVDSCTNAIFLSLKYLEASCYIWSHKTITIPKNTYIGVPQSIVNAGWRVQFDDNKWEGCYRLGNTPIIDSAVDFHRGMYVTDTLQCLSFQQKKRLNIGKGGAILLDNEAAYNQLKMMAHDGRSESVPMKDWSQGWHMNMIPDDAARGLLILNQIELRADTPGSYRDYPDLSVIDYFKD